MEPGSHPFATRYQHEAERRAKKASRVYLTGLFRSGTVCVACGETAMRLRNREVRSSGR